MEINQEEITKIAKSFKNQFCNNVFQFTFNKLKCDKSDDFYKFAKNHISKYTSNYRLDNRTIKKQWQNYCDGKEWDARTNTDLINLIEIYGYFEKNRIDGWTIENINTELTNKEIIKIDENKKADVDELIKYITKNSYKEDPCINYSIAVLALYKIIRNLLFGDYSESIAYLMFKKILSGNGANGIAGIIPFGYPIVKKLYAHRVYEKLRKNSSTLLKANSLVVKVINEILKNAIKDPSIFMGKMMDLLDKFGKKSEITDKIPNYFSFNKMKDMFAKAYESWDQSELCAKIDELVTSNENSISLFNAVFHEMITSGEYKLLIESCAEGEAAFNEIEEYLNLSGQESVKQFFHYVWTVNFIVSDQNSLNKLLENCYDNLLSNQRNDFSQFCLLVSSGFSFFLTILTLGINAQKAMPAIKKQQGNK